MGYVASCCRLMVDWGRPRRLSLETLGTPRWTLIRKKRSKLVVAEECLEESARLLLKSDDPAVEAQVTFDPQKPMRQRCSLKTVVVISSWLLESMSLLIGKTEGSSDVAENASEKLPNRAWPNVYQS